MLNFTLKKEAIAAFEQAQAAHESLCADVKKYADNLHELRRASSEKLIVDVERYINELANSPKEFDKTFSEYRAEYTVFTDHVVELEAAVKKADWQNTSIAVLAVMHLAPIFLRSSAGVLATAIPLGTFSALAPLMLLGPVGLIASVSPIIGGGFAVRKKNAEVANEAVELRKEIEALNSAIGVSLMGLKLLLDLTKEHVEGVENLFRKVRVYAPRDYSKFDDGQRQQMGALINHVHSLSELLNKQVEVKVPEDNGCAIEKTASADDLEAAGIVSGGSVAGAAYAASLNKLGEALSSISSIATKSKDAVTSPFDLASAFRKAAAARSKKGDSK